MCAWGKNETRREATLGNLSGALLKHALAQSVLRHVSPPMGDRGGL